MPATRLGYSHDPDELPRYHSRTVVTSVEEAVAVAVRLEREQAEQYPAEQPNEAE